MVRKRFAGLVAGLALCTLVPLAEAGASDIHEGESAYFQFDLQQAERIFQQVLDDETAVLGDRVEAAQKLAAIRWRIYADAARAREFLGRADELGVKRSKTHLILAGIERENAQYAAAQRAAQRAADFSESEFDRHDAEVESAAVVLTQARSQIQHVEREAHEQIGAVDALARVQSILSSTPGRPRAALVAIGLAVIVGDGPAALDAWRFYFRIPTDRSATGVLAAPARELAELLSSWHGEPIDRDTSTRLAGALAASRLFVDAAVVVRKWRPGTPYPSGVQDILAYDNFLRQTTELAEAAYRAHARGAKHERDLRQGVERLGRELWNDLSWEHDPPSFSFDRFVSEISTRFGAELEYQNSNGHFGLHLGHRVIDEERVIEQYGKNAHLRYVSLDFMASNGYSSWFWDGRAEVGGWARDPRFIQVRSAYIDGGITALKKVSDPGTIREIEDRMSRYAAVDDSLARLNPYCYLPGLAERLRYENYRRIWDDLRALGQEEEELRNTFIAEIDRLSLEASIFAHEGRHAIDKRDFFGFLRNDAEREFRAKLSEVAFSEEPFLALCGGILLANIGDDTSHGRANERIMKGIVDWMGEHADEISELDRERPYLPQLDKLTAEQLRRACRAMDPMAPSP